MIPGETGRLVSSGDAPALTAAIRTLFKDPMLACEMGRGWKDIIVVNSIFRLY